MSRSESRQMGHQLGLRLDDGLYARLVAAARRGDVAPTAMARHLLSQSLGTETERVLPRPRRGSNHKISSDAQVAIQFTGQLGAVGNNLNQAVHQIHTARKSGQITENQYQQLEATLKDLRALYARILEALLDDPEV
ncbi:plasmid mobilization relaxosome protein MobC [Sulfitobacter sp. 1A12126]|uniref:plasmid mobilization relaxosome protein MobC n=1 Tax=Sulfitobacter sp. 1A12126 TaxID=3368591 RepID=UPI0037472A93